MSMVFVDISIANEQPFAKEYQLKATITRRKLGTAVVVCLKDGKIMTREQYGQHCEEVHIASIMIERKYRGRGLGSRLLREIEKDVWASKGMQDIPITLTTGEWLDHFWTKNGYKQIDNDGTLCHYRKDYRCI